MENQQAEEETNVIIDTEEKCFHPKSVQEAEKCLSFE
jgi:hypothetical protein